MTTTIAKPSDVRAFDLVTKHLADAFYVINAICLGGDESGWQDDEPGFGDDEDFDPGDDDFDLAEDDSELVDSIGWRNRTM